MSDVQSGVLVSVGKKPQAIRVTLIQIWQANAGWSAEDGVVPTVVIHSNMVNAVEVRNDIHAGAFKVERGLFLRSSLPAQSRNSPSKTSLSLYSTGDGQ